VEIRLQKWLSQAGIASRRKAEELILDGKVAVNGTIVTKLGTCADTSCDKVTVNGQPVIIGEEKIYIALHKPESVVTTVSDQFNRPTVMDYLPAGIHCYPVGRLDYDTSGLIILTNDGEMAQRLAHPRHGVVKTYVAVIKGLPEDRKLKAFASGLMIEDRLTAPCEIEIIKKQPNAHVCIKLHEGRNRQVRKMCEAIGHPVISLKRVAVGNIKLGNLPKGQWRYLSVTEADRI